MNLAEKTKSGWEPDGGSPERCLNCHLTFETHTRFSMWGHSTYWCDVKPPKDGN